MKKPAPKKFKAREPKRDPRDWRESNPSYEKTPPRSSGCWVEIDAGSWFDYVDGLRPRGIEP